MIPNSTYISGAAIPSGEALHKMIARLYPICRSITGDGVRRSLAILRETIDVDIYEVPSGTQVFDWIVPKEWNIRDAYIKNSAGERLVDFQQHNLHVLNYSVPVKGHFSLEELRPHLHFLEDQPDRIPYKTSYYKETWGFCLSYDQFVELDEGPYEVCIDSDLSEGHLTYGEYVIPGESEEEVLISSHMCHPSLANDNLSGVVIAANLANKLSQSKPHYTYRFIFAPGTIGAITWLAQNTERTKQIKFGLIASLLGDGGKFTYKRSRRGDAEIDRIAESMLKQSGFPFRIMDFSPYGYDERQYCSPGFNLPVGNLGRTPYAQFPEYHTSADNLEFVKPKNLLESFQVYDSIIACIEHNIRYINQFPHCEPQLGARGVYEHINASDDPKEFHMAVLWILNLSDGAYSLLDISERSGISFARIFEVAHILEEKGLLLRDT